MKKYTSIKQLVERFELSDSEHPRPEINKASGERGGFKNLAITMTQVNGKVTKVDNNFIEYTRLRNYFNKLENNQYPSEIRITFNDTWCIDVKYEDGYFWVTYVYCHYDLMVGYGKWGNQFIQDFRSWEYGIFEHNTLAVTETQSYNDIEFEKVEANMYRHPQLRK
jgi:hypothetical protein